MKHRVTIPLMVVGSMFLFTPTIDAQNSVVVTEETVTVVDDQHCNTTYYNTWRDGWFLQAGAGVDIPAMEGFKEKKKVGITYNFGVGRWFSPYFGLRFSGYYGTIHESMPQNYTLSWRSANINADVMWDMFNSIGGVDLSRPVSVVPFVGIGGTYNWRFRPQSGVNIIDDNGNLKNNAWALPVSAGIQVRFRLCRYVDLFLEARAQFAGDSYNNVAYDKPIDINFMGTGGVTVNIGGKSFKAYDPCAYNDYIASLNGQVNDLRGELATTVAALAEAEAESQLPCPEVKETVHVEKKATAVMMSTVRFTINSAKVSQMEMVNVYNVAEYIKANPDVKIVIKGYADKNTGTSSYNQKLSEKRAQAVYDLLVNKYGISPNRLSKEAAGSSSQPYGTNDWNRIVIFSQN